MLLTRLPRAVASRAAVLATCPRVTVARAVVIPRRFQSTTTSKSCAWRRGLPPDADLTVLGKTYPRDEWTNATPTILSKVGRNLHLQDGHPLSTLRGIIENHFEGYQSVRTESPIVSVHQNFDELGFPKDHPGRSKTDSYYVNATHMLRTHTSAHEVESYRSDKNAFLIAADVYRRDEIDSSHYPVFHQMEGMRIWDQGDLSELKAENERLAAELAKSPLQVEDDTVVGPSNPYQAKHNPEHAAEITQNLKHRLNGLILKLFGHVAAAKGEPLRIRWIEAQFPWTSPSFEVEVWFNDDWLEILGCGVVMQQTLETSGMGHKAGWAFGLGLERIAMVLFDIQDIRLFWSTDSRFLNQFEQGKINTFKPYSKYPPVNRDMSFWLPDAAAEGREPWHENDYCEIVRNVAGDLVENVSLVDEFTHPKTGRRSLAYRINYRSMDR
ncbi:hypothetical protein VHUM_01293 [Vanrija humicola]|uniref:Phenylalanine--tRNA ligase, mitochondrial n=1 Tax=Vanrija humicola TaxID=5417 RepID=A0A7D8Z4U9_VANHU|nr:hypothetical protein VHUM_01293 [Vanrija humicola]